MISLKELLREHDGICNNARDLVSERGREYADDNDTLETFRKAALMFGCNPSDVAYLQICLKVARMRRDQSRDSILDLINYAVYFNTLRLDQELEKRCSTKE